MKLTYLMATAAMVAATSVDAAPVQWAGNGHYYEFISSSTYSVWGDAMAAAASMTYAGMTGYLATITSEAEQLFLNGLRPENNPYWLGGSDAANEGVWQWVTEPGGPIPMVYTNWSPGEPNNFAGSEDGMHGWWGSGGAWNDIYDGYDDYGFVVEYSTQAATVPLPASLPLALAGLGALAALRRRKVKA